MQLPIVDILPQLDSILAESRNAVLVAEPGAGKTTVVPPHFLKASWLGNKKIILLEPRRLAARSAVSFMAKQRSEKVGDLIGYRMRGETKVSSNTKLEVLTEGVLTRMIQSNPELEDVGLIIFDEFHERSLNADISLALVLEVQKLIRPDLRVLVMSATLDAEAVSSLMDNAPIVKCPGRVFPVEEHYLTTQSDQPLDRLVAETIRRAAKENQGDILVFLPGRSEISWVSKRLEENPGKFKVLSLFSDMTSDLQDAVLLPTSDGSKKVILATSIAETSLTIEGIGVVIDSGLMRIPQFDPQRGISALETVPVSRASADQRKGRAGRQSSGVCYRLWTAHRHRELRPFNDPEILQADLASLILELSMWGDSDPAKFSFLTQPPTGASKQAQSLLKELGALKPDGMISAHGKEICRLGVSPRIGHMLLKAKEIGKEAIACDLAALLEEKTVLRDRSTDLEISNRWYALSDFRKARSDGNQVLRRVDREAERLRKLLGVTSQFVPGDEGFLGLLTAFAYPDRIAQRREEGSRGYILRSGMGAMLPAQTLLSKSKYLAIAHLDGAEGKVFLCERIDERELIENFSQEISKVKEVTWVEQNLRSREKEMLGALTLKESSVTLAEADVQIALVSYIRQHGLSVLASQTITARIQLLKEIGLLDASWPDFSDEKLTQTLEDWLAPYLQGVRNTSDLQNLDLNQILISTLSWQQSKQLEELAPTHWDLPTGSRVKLDYSGSSRPMLSVRLQEMFGQKETPKIAKGRIPVTLELLSPARRPLQITRDLESFWKNSYLEVRKEMQGRYPKHSWPSDPLTAPPTRKAKPR